ncbi:MAG: double-strand break repair protein AddB, partial [Bdellovibrionales bacterium]
MQNNVFTIPAGAPFAKSLAATLLREYDQQIEALADILILLPTRRACRTLRDSFLQLRNGRPLLLPRMQALGDIDEEELSLSLAAQNTAQDFLSLPPAMTPLKRQILLARALSARPDFTQNFDHAMALARALGHLMDQIHTEGLDLKDLQHLVPEDFAAHWQITLDFLKILSEEWPQILQQLNAIDAADRRNRLIETLAEFWQDHPPQTRIIAAGTTGSIPATARLLRSITGLPNGQIVLPGLDQNIDDQSWDAIGESHPQYGFKHLLETLDIPRDSVTLWPCEDITKALQNRRFLCTELMRPAATTKHWQTLRQTPHNQSRIESALNGLQIYNCADQNDEAATIAILLRQILQDPAKTAAFITPDRTLARRVAVTCKRWGVAIDDSAGTPLSQTTKGRFLTLTAQACESALSPCDILAVLKHPLCRISSDIKPFEAHLLRGVKPPPGIAGLKIRLESKAADIPQNLQQDCAGLIDELDTIISPLLRLYEGENKAVFKDMLTAHIAICETLCGADDQGESPLWTGEDGRQLSAALSSLLDHAHLLPDIAPAHYAGIMQQFLQQQTLRPAYGTHPRLQILGQLEARLIDADLVILGGLNEGIWPPDPGHDPWMSRPMRRNFGLPADERSIGLAAHDFAQGFCAPDVAITYSAQIGGAPAIPARWLERLSTVLQAVGIDEKAPHDRRIDHWKAALDRAPQTTPAPRPAPKPPV